MTIKHTAFVMYPVSDVARAAAFYEDALGLPKGELESPFWREYEVNGMTFGIGNFEQVGKPGSAQSLALEVDDVVAFRNALAAKGVEASEPHELGGCFISVVTDPDGNQVWLHQTKPGR